MDCTVTEVLWSIFHRCLSQPTIALFQRSIATRLFISHEVKSYDENNNRAAHISRHRNRARTTHWISNYSSFLSFVLLSRPHFPFAVDFASRTRWSCVFFCIYLSPMTKHMGACLSGWFLMGSSDSQVEEITRNDQVFRFIFFPFIYQKFSSISKNHPKNYFQIQPQFQKYPQWFNYQRSFPKRWRNVWVKPFYFTTSWFAIKTIVSTVF